MSILQELQLSVISAGGLRPPVNSSALNCIVSLHVDPWRVFMEASRRFIIRRLAYYRVSVKPEIGNHVWVIRQHTENEYTASNHLVGHLVTWSPRYRKLPAHTHTIDNSFNCPDATTLKIVDTSKATEERQPAINGLI